MSSAKLSTRPYRQQSVNVHVSVPAAYRERLVELAERKQLSLSDLFRRALDALYFPASSAPQAEGAEHAP